MVVLIGLVIIFKKQITTLLETASRKRCTDGQERGDNHIPGHDTGECLRPAVRTCGVGSDGRGQMLSSDGR